MFVTLRTAGLGLLLMVAACQQKPTTPPVSNPAAATPPAPVAAAPTATPNSTPLPTPPDTALVRRIAHPQPGDVYVVAYQPAGRPAERYFFYRVSRVTPATVDLLPARQESADSAADVSAAGFFADKALTYTRAEALELLQEQPGDVQHTRLVQIRR